MFLNLLDSKLILVLFNNQKKLDLIENEPNEIDKF